MTRARNGGSQVRVGWMIFSIVFGVIFSIGLVKASLDQPTAEAKPATSTVVVTSATSAAAASTSAAQTTAAITVDAAPTTASTSAAAVATTSAAAVVQTTTAPVVTTHAAAPRTTQAAVAPPPKTATTSAAPAPVHTTQAPNLCGAPQNPWNYNFCGGTPVTSPDSDVCSYFNCIDNFSNGVGYMVECHDGMYSMSGGRRGACSDHGGELRAVDL